MYRLSALAAKGRYFRDLMFAGALIGVAGCTGAPKPSVQKVSDYAHSPVSEARIHSTHPVVAVANGLRGVPYRYGGASPRGFDCSGLVHYAYRQAGVSVPRTTAAQYRHSRSVSITRLSPGDLLFFKVSWPKKVSHVGIYAGGGLFIHAPSSGKRVSYARLNSPYWRRRLVKIGRFPL